MKDTVRDNMCMNNIETIGKNIIWMVVTNNNIVSGCYGDD